MKETVMKLAALILVLSLTAIPGAASAAGLSIDLRPDAGNSPSPQMGDHLSFHTSIRNTGETPAGGIIAWLSLVEVDKGNEQPVDLEDWSAHKAVVVASLAPRGTVETDWPMRLIKAGAYRVIVSAVSRDGAGLTASPFADFTVRRKPVVESRRVLPVALGVPLLIAAAMIWRRRRGAAT